MTQLPYSAPETLATDVECIHCGYNLRGLASDGRCPECGTPVQFSSQGNLLCYSDPEWVQRLLWGVRLALWTILLWVFLAVAGGIAGVFASLTGPTLLRFVPLVTLALQIGGGVVGLASLFLVTSQEPRISLTEDPVTLRKVLRTLAVVGFASGLVQTLVDMFPASTATQLIGIAAAIVSLVWLVSYFGWFVYMRRFARRIPDEKLAKSTSRLMWLSGITVGLFTAAGVVGSILAVMFTGGPGTGAGGPFAPATAPAVSGGAGVQISADPNTASAVVATGDANSGAAATQQSTVTGGGLITVTTPGGTTQRPLGAAVGVLFAVFSCAMFIVMVVCAIWYVILLFKYRDAFRGALAIAERPA